MRKTNSHMKKIKKSKVITNKLSEEDLENADNLKS